MKFFKDEISLYKDLCFTFARYRYEKFCSIKYFVCNAVKYREFLIKDCDFDWSSLNFIVMLKAEVLIYNIKRYTKYENSDVVEQKNFFDDMTRMEFLIKEIRSSSDMSDELPNLIQEFYSLLGKNLLKMWF